MELLPSKREKVVVIMAPTASGKSRLSVELATRFPSEIINSDKIQLYKGLDITTNKIPLEEQLGVPHHLLGNIDSTRVSEEVSSAQFRFYASSLVSDITARGNLPIVVGGSNSFVYAFLAEEFNPELDVFSDLERVCSELRYDCCLLWIDVALPVLNEYIKKRVDDMVVSGMLEELAEFHRSSEMKRNMGLAKAIGVPESKEYVERYGGTKVLAQGCDEKQTACYEEVVTAIKQNTCQLAKRQAEKIMFLEKGGWKIKRLDATESFMALLEGSKGWYNIWDEEVVKPSVSSVKRFLEA